MAKHNTKNKSNEEKSGEKMDEKMDESKGCTNEIKEQLTRTEHKYVNNDKGPFYVLINTKTPKNMISVILARMFKVNNIKIKDITEVNKKLARVEFYSYDKANKCVRNDDPIYKILNEKGYNCFIPKTYTHVEGVVRGLAGEFTMEEIKTNLKCDYPITHIETIQTWDREQKLIKDTNIIKIEIRANELPRQVSFYDVKVNTGIYIPKLRFCSACLSYGHFKKYCRSSIKRCSKCTKPLSEKDPHICQNKPECKFCEGAEHYTNSRNCQEKKKQNQIKIYIIKHKSTYKEAMETLYPKQKNLNKQLDIQDYPNLTKNPGTTSNVWIERANRNDGIIKEQRTKIDQLQEAINEFIRISNKVYTIPDLLTIDLKKAVKNIQAK